MAREEWHADIIVTESMARKCLHEQFPFFASIDEITLMGEGWDNRVFLVNGEYVFRFPRRKIAAELMERENRVLSQLPSFAEIAVPVPEFTGKPTPYYPCPFQGHKFIKGAPSDQAQLSDQERIASLAVLARFLKRLHRIDGPKAKAMGAKPQLVDRTCVSTVAQALIARAEKLHASSPWQVDHNMLQKEINAAKAIQLPKNNACLVHGDLYCRHLLFEQGLLNGIIDWGYVGTNNKSIDLAVIWSFYPPHCRATFLKLYGPVDPATWQYARFLGLENAVILLLYGHNTGDALMVTEAINTIKRISPCLLKGPS